MLKIPIILCIELLPVFVIAQSTSLTNTASEPASSSHGNQLTIQSSETSLELERASTFLKTDPLSLSVQLTTSNIDKTISSDIVIDSSVAIVTTNPLVGSVTSSAREQINIISSSSVDENTVTAELSSKSVIESQTYSSESLTNIPFTSSESFSFTSNLESGIMGTSSLQLNPTISSKFDALLPSVTEQTLSQGFSQEISSVSTKTLEISSFLLETRSSSSEQTPVVLESTSQAVTARSIDSSSIHDIIGDSTTSSVLLQTRETLTNSSSGSPVLQTQETLLSTSSRSPVTSHITVLNTTAFVLENSVGTTTSFNSEKMSLQSSEIISFSPASGFVSETSSIQVTEPLSTSSVFDLNSQILMASSHLVTETLSFDKQSSSSMQILPTSSKTELSALSTTLPMIESSSFQGVLTSDISPSSTSSSGELKETSFSFGTTVSQGITNSSFKLQSSSTVSISESSAPLSASEGSVFVDSVSSQSVFSSKQTNTTVLQDLTTLQILSSEIDASTSSVVSVTLTFRDLSTSVLGTSPVMSEFITSKTAPTTPLQTLSMVSNSMLYMSTGTTSSVILGMSLLTSSPLDESMGSTSLETATETSGSSYKETTFFYETPSAGYMSSPLITTRNVSVSSVLLPQETMVTQSSVTSPYVPVPSVSASFDGSMILTNFTTSSVYQETSRLVVESQSVPMVSEVSSVIIGSSILDLAETVSTSIIQSSFQDDVRSTYYSTSAPGIYSDISSAASTFGSDLYTSTNILQSSYVTNSLTGNDTLSGSDVISNSSKSEMSTFFSTSAPGIYSEILPTASSFGSDVYLSTNILQSSYVTNNLTENDTFSGSDAISNSSKSVMSTFSTSASGFYSEILSTASSFGSVLYTSTNIFQSNYVTNSLTENDTLSGSDVISKSSSAFTTLLTHSEASLTSRINISQVMKTSLFDSSSSVDTNASYVTVTQQSFSNISESLTPQTVSQTLIPDGVTSASNMNMEQTLTILSSSDFQLTLTTVSPLETLNLSLFSTVSPSETFDLSLKTTVSPSEILTMSPLETFNLSLLTTVSPLETVNTSLMTTVSLLETSNLSLLTTVLPLETLNVSLMTTVSPFETSDLSLQTTMLPLETLNYSLSVETLMSSMPETTDLMITMATYLSVTETRNLSESSIVYPITPSSQPVSDFYVTTNISEFENISSTSYFSKSLDSEIILSSLNITDILTSKNFSITDTTSEIIPTQTSHLTESTLVAMVTSTFQISSEWLGSSNASSFESQTDFIQPSMSDMFQNGSVSESITEKTHELRLTTSMIDFNHSSIYLMSNVQTNYSDLTPYLSDIPISSSILMNSSSQSLLTTVDTISNSRSYSIETVDVSLSILSSQEILQTTTPSSDQSIVSNLSTNSDDLPSRTIEVILPSVVTSMSSAYITSSAYKTIISSISALFFTSDLLNQTTLSTSIPVVFSSEITPTPSLPTSGFSTQYVTSVSSYFGTVMTSSELVLQTVTSSLIVLNETSSLSSVLSSELSTTELIVPTTSVLSVNTSVPSVGEVSTSMLESTSSIFMSAYETSLLSSMVPSLPATNVVISSTSDVQISESMSASVFTSGIMSVTNQSIGSFTTSKPLPDTTSVLSDVSTTQQTLETTSSYVSFETLLPTSVQESSSVSMVNASVTMSSSAVTTATATVPTTTTTAATTPASTTTTTPTTTPATTTQNLADTYWVKTVIKVPVAKNVSTTDFKTTMETRLVQAYSTAYDREKQIAEGTFNPLKKRRKKRYTKVGDTAVDMQEITRSSGNVSLVYTVEKAGTLVPASEVVTTLGVLSDQEMAIIMQYVVASKAEPYKKSGYDGGSTTTESSNLWIIGVALGGVVFIIIIIWIILCVVVKKQRASEKEPANQGEPHLIGMKSPPGEEDEGDFDGNRVNPKYIEEVAERGGNSKYQIQSPKRQTYEVNSEYHEEPEYAQVKKTKRPASSKTSSNLQKSRASLQGNSDNEHVAGIAEDAELIQSPTKSKRSRKQKKRRPPDEDDNFENEEVVAKSIHPMSQMYPRHDAVPDTVQYSAEEEEELRKRKEQERKKNKQRIRDKKKRERREAKNDDDVLKEYLASQQEIDVVLDAPPEDGIPDVFKEKSSNSPEKKSQKEEMSYLNEAYSGDESLQEARKKMHKLLDDAFSLISPSASMDGSTANMATSPQKEDRKHEPLYINPPSYRPGEEPGLTTWSPYRAADQVALISMPKKMQTSVISSEKKTNGKRPVALFNDSVPNSTTAEPTFDTPKPIVLKTRQIIADRENKVKKGDYQRQHSNRGSVPQQSSNKPIHNGFESESAGLTNMKSSSLDGRGKNKNLAASIAQSRKTSQRGDKNSVEMTTLNGDLTHKKPNAHHAPLQVVPDGTDETDIVTRNLNSKATPKATIQSIRNELQGSTLSTGYRPAGKSSGTLADIA